MTRRPAPVDSRLSMVPSLGDIALFPEEERMNERERSREVLEVDSEDDGHQEQTEGEIREKRLGRGHPTKKREDGGWLLEGRKESETTLTT